MTDLLLLLSVRVRGCGADEARRAVGITADGSDRRQTEEALARVRIDGADDERLTITNEY